jgi:flagellar basal-body rod protein FlgB
VSGIINGASIELLQKSMDAIWLRQQAIMNNIANSDTPGYKSKKVEFESLLELALKGAKSEDEILSKIREIKPEIVTDTTTTTREDGNNVDLDRENVELARTQIQYEYLTHILSSHINRLKYVINEGRG